MAGSLKSLAGIAEGVFPLAKLVYEVDNRLVAASDGFAARYGLPSWDLAGVQAAFPQMPAALQNQMGNWLAAIRALRVSADTAAAAMPSNDLPAGP